jgi:hypothetical protein
MFSWILEHLGGPMVLIFLGAILGATGALWASIEQGKAQKEIKEKNEEIGRLNQQIASTITGGDSFCYVALNLPEEERNSAIMMLVHEGKYPLYDVHVRIVDVHKFDLIKDKRPLFVEDIQKNETNVNVGNLAPSQARMLYSAWPLPITGKARYNIFISARNGFVTELVRLNKVEGKWRAAYKVDSDERSNKGTLYEKIDPLYPRDKEGHVDWKD